MHKTCMRYFASKGSVESAGKSETTRTRKYTETPKYAFKKSPPFMRGLSTAISSLLFLFALSI